MAALPSQLLDQSAPSLAFSGHQLAWLARPSHYRLLNRMDSCKPVAMSQVHPSDPVLSCQSSSSNLAIPSHNNSIVATSFLISVVHLVVFN